MTEAITRVRDGWDRVDESMDVAADRLVNSPVGMAVAGINLGFGAYFVMLTTTWWQSLAGSTSLLQTLLAGLISLSLLLSGFMLAWGQDV